MWQQIKRHQSWLIVASILIVAGLFRFLLLGDKPFHHDESIHGYYSWILFRDGTYQYHPLSHGPLLYYLMAGAYHLFGVSDATARVAPAVFGLILVGSLFFYRSFFTRRTTYLLVLVAATSPLLIYVSRFARHDMISLALTSIIILGTLSYLARPRAHWLYAVCLAFALSYANHELTYITFGIWLLTVGVTWRLLPNRRAVWRQFLTEDVWHLALALVIGLMVITAFYSSFGHFATGLTRALPNPYNKDSALGYWLEQHGVHRGSQPIYYYFLTLPLYEIGPFILGMVGMGVGLFQRNFAWRFVAIWALLTLVSYSFAGEKMPWLSVHPLLPLLLTSGFLIDRYYPTLTGWYRPKVWVIGGLVLGWTIFVAYRLAFVNPANPVEMAVYVQTTPAVKALRQEWLQPNQPKLTVGTDLTWPLAWYLRDIPYALTQTVGAPFNPVSLVSLDEANQITFPSGTSSQRLPFRAWWVPSSGWPGLQPLFRYYFTREPWSPLGSYDFDRVTLPQSGSP